MRNIPFLLTLASTTDVTGVLGATLETREDRAKNELPFNVSCVWRYIYDKIQFTEMAIQLVESDIQQVKFDQKKATKGEKH